MLVLHDLRGMEASRIAEVLDTNILTVRTRLFYARRELLGMLRDEPALEVVERELREESLSESPEPLTEGEST